MRNFERVLKVAFLVLAVLSFMYGSAGLTSKSVLCFLVVSFLLGIVLIFNKKASYNFKQSKRDLLLRRIEGVILVLLAPLILLYGMM